MAWGSAESGRPGAHPGLRRMALRQALGGPEGGSDAVSQSQLLAELARPILPLTTVYPGQVLGTVHLILATSVGGKSANGHESTLKVRGIMRKRS